MAKLVFVIVGFVLTLCQASGQLRNTLKSNQPSFYIPPSGIARAPTQSRSLDSVPGTIIDDPISTTSKPTSKPTTIDDREYWQGDSFQPYKIDSRDYFDWRLISQVFSNEKTNLVISPFSVKFVLTLLFEAANGETATKRELASIFYKTSSEILLKEVYHNMLQSLKERSSKYTLNFATKMYLRNNLIPRANYENTLKDQYDTDIQLMNFSNPEESANIINSWCSNVTQGHLKQLVSSDNIENSVLLLINAIYFDGKWRKPFNERFESVFFRQPMEQIRAEFMTLTDKFFYFQSTMWNAKVLRLPYEGNKFSMTIILPGARGGLDELAREIEGDALRRIQWLMTEQQVKVTIPKFKFDYTAELKDTLMALGINEIFTEKAALSGIVQGDAANREIKVSNIFQKAGIVVHETGTTAYAATDVEIVNKFGGDSIEEFNANRPFIFLIVDEGTNNILFAGKVHDPTV